MPEVIVVDRPPSNADLADAKRKGNVIVLKQPGGQMFVATGPGQFGPMTPEVQAMMEAPAAAPAAAGAPPAPPPPGAPPPGAPPGAPPPPTALAGAAPNVSRFTSGSERATELERAGTESDVQSFMAEEARKAADPLGAFGIGDRAKIDAILKANPGMPVEQAIEMFKSAAGGPAIPPPPAPGKSISGGPAVMGGPPPGMMGGLPRPPRMG